MKKMLILSLLTALPLVAQETGAAAPDMPQSPQGERPAAGDRQVQRERLIQKFDVNKDGKLDEQEKAAMEKFLAERRRDRAEGQGKNRRPHGAEGKEGKKPSHEEILKRFDKDQDGKLSEEERAAMREELGKHRRRPHGAEGKPGCEKPKAPQE